MELEQVKEAFAKMLGVLIAQGQAQIAGELGMSSLMSSGVSLEEAHAICDEAPKHAFLIIEAGRRSSPEVPSEEENEARAKAMADVGLTEEEVDAIFS